MDRRATHVPPLLNFASPEACLAARARRLSPSLFPNFAGCLSTAEGSGEIDMLGSACRADSKCVSPRPARVSDRVWERPLARLARNPRMRRRFRHPQASRRPGASRPSIGGRGERPPVSARTGCARVQSRWLRPCQNSYRSSWVVLEQPTYEYILYCSLLYVTGGRLTDQANRGRT